MVRLIDVDVAGCAARAASAVPNDIVYPVRYRGLHEVGAFGNIDLVNGSVRRNVYDFWHLARSLKLSETLIHLVPAHPRFTGVTVRIRLRPLIGRPAFRSRLDDAFERYHVISKLRRIDAPTVCDKAFRQVEFLRPIHGVHR